MSWTHLEDTEQRSRKKRVCHLCGQFIPVGCVYLRRRGVWESKFVSQPMHIECEVISREWDEMDWESHMIGDGDWPERDENGNVA